MRSRVLQSIAVAAVFLVLYAIVGAVILFAAPARSGFAIETAVRPWEIGAIVVAALLFGALFIRRVNVRMVIELLLGFLLLLGVWLCAWRAFGDAGLLVAGALTVIQAWLRNVWVHNAFVVMGAAGAILYIAFLFPPLTWVVLLVGIAAYDTVAGRAKGVPKRFAHAVIHRGIVPLVVLPAQLRARGNAFVEVVRQSDAVTIGVTDLVLPGLLIAHAATRGGIAPWMVIVAAAGAAAWGIHTQKVPLLVPVGIASALSLLVV